MAFATEQKPQNPQTLVPTTGAAAFAPQQQAFQTGYNALGKSQDIAGQTGDVWSAIGKANEAQTQQGLQALQRQAAATLYANRGSLGGGGGLAALQQNNAANAQQQAAYNANANAQRAQIASMGQQAQLQAQNQIAAAAGNQYRMLQDQQQRQIRINAALDAARQVMQRHAGTIYTTDSDKAKAADDIEREVLATESDPLVIAAVQNYVQQLRSGNTDTPNSIG